MAVIDRRINARFGWRSPGEEHSGAGYEEDILPHSRWLSRPEKIMGMILLAVLVILVVMPLIQIVIGASTYSYSDVSRRGLDAEIGDWTIYHWQRVVASQMTPVLLVKPLPHSLAIALGVVLIALPFGSLLAWLVVRTDLPFKKLMGNLSIIPYACLLLPGRAGDELRRPSPSLLGRGRTPSAVEEAEMSNAVKTDYRTGRKHHQKHPKQEVDGPLLCDHHRIGCWVLPHNERSRHRAGASLSRL